MRLRAAQLPLQTRPPGRRVSRRRASAPSARSITPTALERSWPQLAALGGPLGAAALLAGRRRLDRERALALSGLAVLMCHQIEEWVRPDGFGAWMNRTVLRSRSDRWPLTPARACAVNVYAGWGSSAAAALLVKRAPLLQAALAGSHLSNAALHLLYALRERRWNPGALTAGALLLPWGAAALWQPLRRGHLTAPQALLGAAVGGASLPALIGRMRSEAARDRRARRTCRRRVR